MMEAARSGIEADRAESKRIARMYAHAKEAWSQGGATSASLTSGSGTAGRVRAPCPQEGHGRESHRIGEGSGDDMSWYVPASDRRVAR